VTAPDEAGWRRLSARMLLVHPVQGLVRALPGLFGLAVAGTSSGNGGRWVLGGLALAILAGMARWFTTRYRITPEQVQLKSGLLRRRLRAVALDRVRTVDVTANAMHRLLGLSRVTVGTGRSDTGADAGLRLDGLDRGASAVLRDELLHRRGAAPAAGGAPATTAPPEDEIARLRPAWIAYGPFTLSGLVTLGVIASFAANAISESNVDPRSVGPLRDAGNRVETLDPALAIAVSLAFALLAVAVFSALGYVLAYWGFRLTRRPEGTLHVVRGLITTRAVTIEERRLRGVELSEPLLLRAARGARCAAIATGLRAGRGRDRGGALLLPPAPRAEAGRVATAVLGTDEPLTCPLIGHGPRARRRRYTRALTGATPVAVAAVGGAAVLGWPAWTWLVAVLPLAVAAALAADRARNLGHAVTGTALVARAGSLVRERSMLARDGIIGLNVSRSFFQRRAGLVTLTATTAAGEQAYAVLDVTPAEALRVAEAAMPGLLAPFLAEPGATAGTPARGASRARLRSAR
jgi:putative membrane protein